MRHELNLMKGVNTMYYAIICIYTSVFISGILMDIFTALD